MKDWIAKLEKFSSRKGNSKWNQRGRTCHSWYSKSNT